MGGSVLRDPLDWPGGGRVAVLSDQSGAVFGVGNLAIARVLR